LQIIAIFSSSDAIQPSPPIAATDTPARFQYEPPKHFVYAPLLIPSCVWPQLGLGLSIAVPVLEHIRRPAQRWNPEVPFSHIPFSYLPFSFPLYMYLVPCTEGLDLQSRMFQETRMVLDAISDSLPQHVRNWIPSERHRRAAEIMQAWEGEDVETGFLLDLW
jgi:hypothetical protein